MNRRAFALLPLPALLGMAARARAAPGEGRPKDEPQDKPQDNKPQDNKPQDKPMTFTSGGRRIAVEWFPPIGIAAGASAPGILLLHGAEGLAFADGYRMAAHATAATGIGVAFVHYFNRTGDDHATLGRMRTAFPPWSETVRDAMTWLGERPGIDRERLGVVGVSLGAALALHVAANGEGRIKAIVDFFGPVSTGVLPRKPKLPPVLILHGALDAVVPLVHARTLETVLKAMGTPYEIMVYPDQGHGFLGAAQLDAAGRSAAFLARHLAARPAG